jgi:hypothetical protein
VAQPKTWSANHLAAPTQNVAITNATLAQAEAAQGTGTHVGTVTADFNFTYVTPGGPPGGVILRSYNGQFVTADPALYTALGGASPVYPITWND